MRRVSPLFMAPRDFLPGSRVSQKNAVSIENMIRLTVMLIVVLLAGTAVRAQTPPAQERPRPRPGTILETPGTGRITDAPTPQQQQTRKGELTGQLVERFE